MAKTITELQQERVQRQAAIMERCFKLTEQARQVRLTDMSSTATAHLGSARVRNLQAAEGEVWASGERDNLRAEFEASEELYKQQVEERKEEILDALFGNAKNGSPEQFMQYVQASPDQLQSVLECAVVCEQLEVIQLVTLVAYERDLAMVLARLQSLVEEIGDLLGELSMADDAVNEYIDDAAAYFEMVAPESPSREKILMG